jgi:hypothetical protein
MNTVSSEAIIRKFEKLPENAKREVADFIDFLIQKETAKKKKIDKGKLLEVSCWDDERINSNSVEEVAQKSRLKEDDAIA